MPTPIIVLTADIEPETRARLLEQGASDFVAKPFNEKELFARIGVTLRLRQQEQRLDALAHKDGLTEIANRREFDRQLADGWHSALAAGQPLSLLICDIDFFKRFNDRYGHLAGDDCLKQVAQVITAALYRTVDLAARYGGEEFAVLLPVTNRGRSRGFPEDRGGRTSTGNPHDQSETANVVTVSVGGFTLSPSQTGPWRPSRNWPMSSCTRPRRAVGTGSSWVCKAVVQRTRPCFRRMSSGALEATATVHGPWMS